MTSDKIKTALIAYLNDELTLPVVDAEQFSSVELPCVAVKITQAQKVSLALAKVEQITIEVIYRAHSGDTDDRADVMDNAEAIAALLVDPSAIKSAITSEIEDGVVIDFLQFSGGMPSWDEATLECTWEGECYAQRGTVA